MTKLYVNAPSGTAEIDEQGFVRMVAGHGSAFPSNPIGTIAYDNGFGRYVARGSNGKLRQFTQSERETGYATKMRAARWLVKHCWFK